MSEGPFRNEKPYPVSCVVAGFVNFGMFIYLIANVKGFLFGETTRSLADTTGSPAGIVIWYFVLMFYLFLLAMYLSGAIFGALAVVFRKSKNWVRTMASWLSFAPIILTIAWYIGRAILSKG